MLSLNNKCQVGQSVYFSNNNIYYDHGQYAAELQGIYPMSGTFIFQTDFAQEQ